MKAEELKVGERVRATGRDTRGWTTTREGFVVVEPKNVEAQWDRSKRPAIRLHVDPNRDAGPTRQNWLTVLPGTEVEELDA
ncbi:hypothetical protein [Streptomyces narbonensis]|uniref:hypothetical protein n=1 Tax=Streptomyces narbonensis TaxID=67333 RepID=UPI0033D5F140